MANMIHYIKCPECGAERDIFVWSNLCNCKFPGPSVVMEEKVRPCRYINGSFKIIGFENLGYGTSALVILEKDGEKFKIRMRTIHHLIIGKEYIDLHLREYPSGSWGVYWPDYSINVYDCKSCGKCHGGQDDIHYFGYGNRCNCDNPDVQYVKRDRKIVDDTFTIIGHYRSSSKTTERLKLLGSDGKEYEVFFHEVFDKLRHILMGGSLKLQEDKRGGTYIWTPRII